MGDENRIKTYAAYPAAASEVEASEMNQLQDACTFLYGATETTATLPVYSWSGGTGFAGCTTFFGEYTIAAGADEALENSRDWRNRQLLIFVARVSAANRLPSGANHSFANVDEFAWTSFNTQDGFTIGGPFAGDHPYWQPFAGWAFHLYADPTNGYLYASEDDVAARYIYLMAFFTDATE